MMDLEGLPIAPTRPPSDVPACGLIWLLAQSPQVAALSEEIRAYGYAVVLWDRAAGFPRSSVNPPPDLIIVEAVPDDRSLVSFLRTSDGSPSAPGVMVIERHFDPLDRILAFELGVDDCVPWPCSTREIVARIRAIARRREPAEPTIAIALHEPEDHATIHFAGWSLSRHERRLNRPGKRSVVLSASEFAVLDTLLQSPGEIVDRPTFLKASATMPGRGISVNRSIDLLIVRLRRRLESDRQEIIRTVRGRGYVIVVPVSRCSDRD